MKNHASLFPILLFIFLNTNVLKGQTNDNGFATYANHQGELMHNAYVARDFEKNRKLLDELVDRYNKLSKTDRANYRGYITNAYYNQSCIYSILNNKPMALAYLDSSVKKGYYDYSHIKEDSDMDNIRNEVRFKQLTETMRSVGDYHYILVRGEKYNFNDRRAIPAFVYESSKDSCLVSLRKTFKLDSVAGAGNDISQVLSILHWVHNTVAHDGQHESGIDHINALNIINTATAKNIGVSCGELATVLNDCYLAMGYKAKKIYCFPKDSLKMDYDSHVINVVYVPSLKKWIWTDPTNNAYVMDQNGTLLSIEEVRERIINNEPLIVNPDANWNHKAAVTKDYYLGYYMAKNLYKLCTPLYSQYNYQTTGCNNTIAYIYLLPFDALQGQNKTEFFDKGKNTTFISYNTNNPAVFWKAPSL